MNRVNNEKYTTPIHTEIYKELYTTYNQNTRIKGANIHDAAAKLTNVVDKLIIEDQYNYDLEVLEKTGHYTKVKNVRGEVSKYADFTSNSYNDLDFIEENRENLLDYTRTQPLGSCLSRKIAGRLSVHDQLEEEIKDFLGYEKCVIGTCGYISQVSTLFSLFNPGDVIFSDMHNHSSLIDGCRLSRAKLFFYRHLDYDHLETLLKRNRYNFNAAGIVSDGIFSTKGSRCAIDRINELSKTYDCLSVIDDTHGVCVVGEKGRGLLDFSNTQPDVLTGGFSKAFGAFGGFAVAKRNIGWVIDIFGRQNVNTSHLSPLAAAQSLINLKYYRKHHDELATELFGKLHLFNSTLAQGGINCYDDEGEGNKGYIHPIFCFYRKSEIKTLECMRTLLKQEILSSFFPPPVAPYPSLRFSLHRMLLEEDILRAANCLKTLKLFVEKGI
ncbi:MAG: aminotransferase class I/II-fold pyridoxal phosphate-dependent enzyme [Candidatus Omnitrophota bacterium]